MDNQITEDPRYVYMFGGDIDVESVQKLIDVLHSHEKIDLFFNTDGGLLLVMSALLHYMNQHPDLRIFLTYQVCSTGFDIMMFFKGKVFITKEFDLFMIHCADRKIYMNREYEWDTKKLQKYTNQRNLDYYEILQDTFNITDKEIRDMKKGKDVYLYREDLPRLTANKDNITIL